MGLVLDYAVDLYNHTMQLTDPRTDKWFMIDSPWPTMFIIGFYVYFSIALGPQLMKNREPMELHRVMIIYNIGLVFLSGYILVSMLWASMLLDVNIRYQPNDFSNNPVTLDMIRVAFLGYIMKIIELMDTVFIVLRKKSNQISLLHLYHHGSMPFTMWLFLRFIPGGHQCGLAACINCYIHVLMYSYYALTAMGPRFRKYTWFKRYLTQMQIAQFVIALVHVGQLLIIEHNYPMGVMKYGMFNTSVFLILFVHYYINEYKGTHAVNCTVSESIKKID